MKQIILNIFSLHALRLCVKQVFILLFIFCNTISAQQKSLTVETINGKKYFLHIVKSEETLLSISKIYGITVNELLIENNYAIDGIKSGDVLKMPVKEIGGVTQASDSVKTSSAKKDSAVPKLVLSGYVDAYYAYYNDSVGPGNYQKFPTIAPRSEFGLNTFLLSVQYNANNVRALATLHYGDISGSSWSPVFNSIVEANAGFRLVKKLWLDAGFFRTHIGTEGLLPKENIVSSLAVGSYFEPYYEAGFRFNYVPNKKLALNLFLLNGYNMFDDNNRKKSLGLLVTYALGEKGNFGYSNYVGDDTPIAGDSVSHLRIYQNAFLNYKIKKIKIQAGADLGLQQHSYINNVKKKACVYNGLLSVKYQLKKKVAIYMRGEVFEDAEGILSGVFVNKKGSLTGDKLFGITAGGEVKPTDDSFIRLESRYLQSQKDEEIFHANGKDTNSRLEIILNMGISF